MAMIEAAATKQVKSGNRQQIYDFIYRHKRVSQQDLAYALHLSRPTVTTNLTRMEAEGLVYKNGQIEIEQIGRKAVAYSIVKNYRVGVGVELTKKKAKIVVIDLYGEVIELKTLNIHFENHERYYKKISAVILNIITALGLRDEQVLGVGFTLQGLASADGRTIVYGVILGCTGLKIDVFSSHLPYPCSFLHDSEGAALSELWNSPELSDAIYLSLSYHFGAALISKRQIMAGKHGHSATFEHMQIKPRGELCYCGRRGCLETVCSMNSLLQGEDAASFFQAVRNDVQGYKKRWQTYLKYLARAISTVYLVYDMDFILGGHLAPYFTKEDIQFLYEEVRRNAPFEEASDFILLSKMPSHNIVIGVALPYIRKFLEDIEAKD